MKTKSGIVLAAGLLALSLTQVSRANDAYRVEGYHHEPYVTRQFQGHGMNNPYSSRRLRPFGYSQDYRPGRDDHGSRAWGHRDLQYGSYPHNRYCPPGGHDHYRDWRNPGYGMSLYYYR